MQRRKQTVSNVHGICYPGLAATAILRSLLRQRTRNIDHFIINGHYNKDRPMVFRVSRFVNSSDQESDPTGKALKILVMTASRCLSLMPFALISPFSALQALPLAQQRAPRPVATTSSQSPGGQRPPFVLSRNTTAAALSTRRDGGAAHADTRASAGPWTRLHRPARPARPNQAFSSQTPDALACSVSPTKTRHAACVSCQSANPRRFCTTLAGQRHQVRVWRARS